MENTIIATNRDNQKRTLLTRKETALLLKIDLVTLWSWTAKGLLKSYGIGRRIFYYEDEVLGALKPLN